MSATRNRAAARTANVEGGTVDLLTQAVERAAAILAYTARPTKERIRLLRAAAKTDRSAGDDFRHVDQPLADDRVERAAALAGGAHREGSA